MERSNFEELVEKLERQRDELKLRAHLAKAEARDEWEELETKWDRLRSRLKAAGEEADVASEDVRAAASILADELKKGYERIRQRL
ncbi:MAG: hypothetical protein V3W35_06400 [Gemmatimonadota bacterium]|nr:hypothetical protein [Gemmatimonadota bacterium]